MNILKRCAKIQRARVLLQSRVVHAIHIAVLVALVCLVIVADSCEISLIREDNLVRLFDVLHSKTLADVPSDVTMLQGGEEKLAIRSRSRRKNRDFHLPSATLQGCWN